MGHGQISFTQLVKWLWSILLGLAKFNLVEADSPKFTYVLSTFFLKLYKLGWNRCTNTLESWLLARDWWRLTHFLLFKLYLSLPVIKLILVLLPLSFEISNSIIYKIFVENKHMKIDALLATKLSGSHSPWIRLLLLDSAMITFGIWLTTKLHSDRFININITPIKFRVPTD